MSSLIRISMVQRSLSAPHGFSQTATSFFACNRQGIHHIHLVTWSYNPTAYCPAESQVTITLYAVSQILKVLKNSCFEFWMQSQPVSNQSISNSHEIRNFILIETLCFTKFLKNIDSFELSLWFYHTHFDLSFKKARFFRTSLKSQIVVEPNGIEPMTFCLQSRRSTNWATAPSVLPGGSGRIRTFDPRLIKTVL